MSDDEKNYNSSRHTSDKARKRKKKSNLPFGCSSRLAVCGVLLLICSMAVLIVAKWKVVSPNGAAEWWSFADSKNAEFAVDISGITVMEKNFQNTASSLIYVSDTSVVSLNHDGDKKYSEQHSFTNPMLKCSQSQAVAFNEGGADFRILSDEGELYRGTQGTAITDCDIADSGTYAVIADQTGFLAKLSVFDKNNEYIYGYSFNDYYAVSVSLNEKGTMAAVGAVNTVDGQLVSQVYVLDFTKTSPVCMFTYENRLIYEVKFIGDDKAAVVTDSMVSVVDCISEKEVPYDYDSRVLTAYNISYGGGIVLSLSRSDDERSCTVVSIDGKGSEAGSFSTDMRIVSIDVKNDKIALLSSNTLYLYNAYGDKFGEWDAGTDAKAILLPQEKTAYILGVSEVRKIQLK